MPLHSYHTSFIHVDTFRIGEWHEHVTVCRLYDVEGNPIPTASGTVNDIYRVVSWNRETRQHTLNEYPLY